MTHRREIDGLRALAVLPVILFHAGFATFGGGFVGVDVFFVISGYLITGIILRDLSRGQFSIRRFYERRARRILPALFTVMFACIPFAFLWMLPSQYDEFSRSILAVVLFISNLFFWHESGYFAAEAAEKPLLHTWSLGVEEQFYLLFPLLLMLLWRWKKLRMLPMMMALALLSLGLSEYASRYYLNVNFFFLPTRAWELLIGAMAAFSPLHTTEKRCASLLALLGIVLIIAAIFTFTEAMRLPSALSLIPTLGTALVLRYAATGTLAAKLLSWPPLVGIGLISYSAYLWHQPLFAFARIRMLATPDHTVMLALAAAALLLGALSWKFIEQPFRYKHHPRYFHNKSAAKIGVLVAIIFTIIGVSGHYISARLGAWNAYAQPKQVHTFALLESVRPAHVYDNGDCAFMANEFTAAVQERLIRCHAKYGPGIAIIGDSHAISLFFVLNGHRGTHPFIADIAQAACRADRPEPSCYYDALQTLLAKHAGLFRDIIYEQSGAFLFTDAQGNQTSKHTFVDAPMDARIPDLTPDTQAIGRITNYLTQLSQHSRITWLGPRIEPHIRKNVVVHYGCDYPFALRPNLAENFHHLDATIQTQLAHSAIRYRSQIDLLQFDMAKDYIICDAAYWKDGDHFSIHGEERFAERITLDKLLDR